MMIVVRMRIAGMRRAWQSSAIAVSLVFLAGRNLTGQDYWPFWNSLP
ncbi:MAG: hypothetical protein WB760_25065 [Xanthobacteraceae bacterium]